MQWHMPEKPESKPFLAVIRLTGGQLTAANAAVPGPDWLADVESAIGFLLMKSFSEWGSRFEDQGTLADITDFAAFKIGAMLGLPQVRG